MDARVNKGYDNINDSLRATQCNALHYIAPHCNSLQRAATQEPTGMDALMNNDYDNINDSLTATHCNTLQHTATHCTTLQLTAPRCDTGTHRHGRTHEQRLRQHQRLTHCNTLQHTATHCNTLQRIAPHCNTMQIATTQEPTDMDALMNKDYDNINDPSLLRFLVDVRGADATAKQVFFHIHIYEERSKKETY